MRDRPATRSKRAAAIWSAIMAPILNPFSLEKPLKLSICYTETCNLSCQHCYADCSPEKAAAELNSEQWGRFLDEIAELGVVYLYIEGGEPFHPPCSQQSPAFR